MGDDIDCDWEDDPTPVAPTPVPIRQQRSRGYVQNRDGDDGDKNNDDGDAAAGDGDGGDSGHYRGGRGGRGRGRGGYQRGRGGGDRDRSYGGGDGETDENNKENDGDNDNGGRGRGRGRGGRGRGGGRGGRGGQCGGGGGGGGGSGDEGEGENDESNATGEGEGGGGGEEEVKKELYFPEALLEGDDLIKERNDLYTGVGSHFESYDTIKVEKSENCKAPVAHTFEEMGLRNLILTNVQKMGYKKPTPIQKHASPVLLQKKDLMACAQTGSGKTAAFLLPIIQMLMSEEDLPCSGNFPVQPSALILAPTRELAKQIDKEAHIYAFGSILRCVCMYGGTALNHQKNQLGRGCHILVATPGRLLQFLNENKIDLSALKFFVLDEADRMLDMGFMDDVKKIVEKIPPKGERVSALFSATFPEAIQKSANDFLQDYAFVVIGMIGGACLDVVQTFYKLDRKEKRQKLMDILGETGDEDKILIFCNSKKGCDFLAAHLSTQQISSTSIHGDRLQSQRELALREFTTGKRKVLVGTAVAARGLDIPKVTMVINYDLPSADQVEEYVHRIGRTGRVGHTGKAVSFYDEENDTGIAEKLVPILKGAGQEVPEFFGADDEAGTGAGGDQGAASNDQTSADANADEWLD